MNFYHAYYTKQRYNENLGLWCNTAYDHQSIIVIADNYDEAKKKIEKCLAKVESGKYRAILNGDIVECIGVNGKQGFEGSFYLEPIEF